MLRLPLCPLRAENEEEATGYVFYESVDNGTGCVPDYDIGTMTTCDSEGSLHYYPSNGARGPQVTLDPTSLSEADEPIYDAAIDDGEDSAPPAATRLTRSAPPPLSIWQFMELGLLVLPGVPETCSMSITSRAPVS